MRVEIRNELDTSPCINTKAPVFSKLSNAPAVELAVGAEQKVFMLCRFADNELVKA